MVLDINNADNFYIYNNHVDKLYFQGEEIWSNRPNFKARPLTIEPISTGGTLTVTVYKNSRTYARYSKDLSTWTDLTNGDNYINVNSGENVYLRSIGSSYTSGAFSIDNINADFYYKVSGNILSLVYGDDFNGQEYIDRRGSEPQYQSLTLYGGYNLFKNSTTLLYANNLYISSYVLQYYQLNQDDPVSTYAVTPFDFGSFFEGCTSLLLPPILWVLDRNDLPYNVTDVIFCGSYNSMFKNCYSLLRAPYIPTGFCRQIVLSGGQYQCQSYKYGNMFENCTSITSVNDLNEWKFESDGYQRMPYSTEMFKGCTSLTTAPKLPKLKSSYLTFDRMFKGCTSLTTAPDIDVEIISNVGLREMFSGCSNLNYVKCLATEINQAGIEDWLNGVSSTGTFVKDANTTWPSGASGIPTGWTVRDNRDYSKEYFTIESLENNNEIYLIAVGGISGTTVDISTDNGSTWTSKVTAASPGTLLATLNTGDKLLVKGSNTTYATSANVYNNLSSSKTVNVYGNIISLCYGDNFIGQTSLINSYAFTRFFYGNDKLLNVENLILPATTLTDYCYYYMFAGCTSLVNAPALPATTLTNYCYSYMFSGCTSLTAAPALQATTLSRSCYANMFDGCTSLVNAPALPATTLANYCYQSMFKGCNSLVSAPVLPATTLSRSCYANMFYGCTSLVNAPALPATTLTDYCYSYMFSDCTSLTAAPALQATTLSRGCYANMFYGCTSLNYIKCLATDISATNCLTDWTNNVAATGDFYKDANTTWPTGDSGIPSGWTVINV